jgi:hypothetical protein
MELLIKLSYVLGAGNLLIVIGDAFIPRHSLTIDLQPDLRLFPMMILWWFNAYLIIYYISFLWYGIAFKRIGFYGMKLCQLISKVLETMWNLIWKWFVSSSHILLTSTGHRVVISNRYDEMVRRNIVLRNNVIFKVS